MAQAYNHMIMPLANRRDKITQVVWGIRDFEHRFGRRPEGMWLPETAVDTETLEILAEHKIRFTVLAARQARRESKIGGRVWKDVSGERIDPSMAYLCRLPSGRDDQPVLLRRPHFPGHRLRESAGQRRSSSSSASCPVSPRTCGPGPNWSTSPPTARPSATITKWAK